MPVHHGPSPDVPFRWLSAADLAPLGLAEVAAIGGAALWLVLLWWVGRGRLLERFLGIDPR